MFGNKFRKLALGIAGALLVPLALPTTATAAPTSWRMLDLGAGDHSIAWAINDRGHVVGSLGDGEAFLWRNGRTTDLGVFVPTDVNNRDEVVGYRWDDETGGPQAVLWRKGRLVELRAPAGSSQSNASAINDRSLVVGWSTADADGSLRAVSWRGGVPTMLDNSRSLAFDVNNRGQIVGASGDNAVRWWHGNRTTLTTQTTQATAVNRHGTVAGRHWDSFSTGGFVWQRGMFVGIAPPPSEADFTFIQPTGINGRTQVVGNSNDGAFVWERGRTTYLPGLTRATEANDINDRGVIAGANPTTTDGLAPHAVIWRR